MDEVPQVIEDLVALGESGGDALASSLSDPGSVWPIQICGGDVLEIAHGLTSGGIAKLIRGLVLYSSLSGRTGGSASSVIPLYKTLVEREPSWEPELTHWIVKHRVNPYEPFGTIYDEGATSLAEFTERRRARLLREKEAASRRLVERENAVRRARSTRATGRLAAAVRRGDLLAVQALMRQGADPHQALPDGSSLVSLADRNGRTAIAAFLRSMGIP